MRHCIPGDWRVTTTRFQNRNRFIESEAGRSEVARSSSLRVRADDKSGREISSRQSQSGKRIGTKLMTGSDYNEVAVIYNQMYDEWEAFKKAKEKTIPKMQRRRAGKIKAIFLAKGA